MHGLLQSYMNALPTLSEHAWLSAKYFNLKGTLHGEWWTFRLTSFDDSMGQRQPFALGRCSSPSLHQPYNCLLVWTRGKEFGTPQSRTPFCLVVHFSPQGQPWRTLDTIPLLRFRDGPEKVHTGGRTQRLSCVGMALEYTVACL